MGSSCILKSIQSCPALQYIPDAFTYDLGERTLAQLLDDGNMVKFCGRFSQGVTVNQSIFASDFIFAGINNL